MELLEFLLTLSILLCTLVAGLVYTFAVVVMPGIKTLPDHDFLRAFQVIDRVIQNGHPLFILVWLGSVVSLLALCIVATNELCSHLQTGIFLASGLYLLGVQVPTLAINVPLNNRLQALDLNELTDINLKQVRLSFELAWIKWNARRTVAAVATSAVLILVAVNL